MITKVLVENYASVNKGILGAIQFALKTLCVVVEPNPKCIEVSVTALNRPFEVSEIFKFQIKRNNNCIFTNKTINYKFTKVGS